MNILYCILYIVVRPTQTFCDPGTSSILNTQYMDGPWTCCPRKARNVIQFRFNKAWRNNMEHLGRSV